MAHRRSGSRSSVCGSGMEEHRFIRERSNSAGTGLLASRYYPHKGAVGLVIDIAAKSARTRRFPCNWVLVELGKRVL